MMKRSMLKLFSAVVLFGGLFISSIVFAKDAPKLCDEIWIVSYSGSVGTNTSVTVTCTTGGDFKCPICLW